MNSIYADIVSRMDGMSKSQKKIAKYILVNKDNVAFLNVSQLAKMAQVSEASVVRFSSHLGYKGYPQFQKEIQKEAKNRLSIKAQRTESITTYSEREKDIVHVFNREIENLKADLTNFDFEEFFQVCDEILSAKHIYIISSREAVSIGSFFSYYLNLILGNTRLVDSIAKYEEEMVPLAEESLVIGITFKRYSKQTSNLVEAARDQGARIIVITDNELCPIVKYSQHYLLCNTGVDNYLDSFTSAQVLLNALLFHIGKIKEKDIVPRLHSLEDMWKKLEIFDE